jgi:hypothetical protein
MKVHLAHIHDQRVDFAVFEADAQSRLDSDRAGVLQRLVFSARRAGLKIDKAALAFRQGNTIAFYGTADLVQYLQHRGVPQWTHTIDA